MLREPIRPAVRLATSEPPGFYTFTPEGGGDPLPTTSAGDFASGVYEIDGSPVAIGQIMAEDADNWGSFNPATDIEPGVGIFRGDPALGPGMLAKVLAGTTIILDVCLSGNFNITFDLADPDYSTMYQLALQPAGSGQNTRITDNDESAFNTPGELAVGPHRVVMNIADGEFAMSIDGDAVVALATPDAWTPAPEFLGFGLAGNVVMRILTVDLQDQADLPALSEHPAWPINTVAPVITGTAQVGQTLSVSNGTWSNSPASYAYQWWYGFGSPIVGANASTYELQPADEGQQMMCIVAAANDEGTIPANSNVSDVVAPV